MDETISSWLKHKRRKVTALHCSGSFLDTKRKMGNTEEENELHYPKADVTKMVNELFDEIVTDVSVEKCNLKPHFQTAGHKPLHILLTRFNYLRRNKLLYIEAAIQMMLERYPVQRQLEGLSKKANSQSEIEYIQSATYAMLKRVVTTVDNRRRETLDIRSVLKLPFHRDIKPELERLVTRVNATRVNARRELLDIIDAMLKICKIGTDTKNPMSAYFFHERQDLLDIRFVLEAMSEKFRTEERQKEVDAIMKRVAEKVNNKRQEALDIKAVLKEPFDEDINFNINLWPSDCLFSGVYEYRENPLLNERQDLLDIQIVLDAMLENYFTNERQRDLDSQTILDNEEKMLLGIQTAIDIIIYKDQRREIRASGVDKRHELQGIRCAVDKILHGREQNRQEVSDIKAAVHMMLDRIITRVNKKGMFKISRVEPCGSMTEQTAVWKYGKETQERYAYTEFDSLAVLNCSPDIICRNHDCRGLCVEVSEMPTCMPFEAIDEINDVILEFKRTSGQRDLCDRLFWREIHTCLDSICDCFTIQFNEQDPWYRVSYTPASCDSGRESLCNKCIVEMPTGILRVNSSVSVGRFEEANCSLAFSWTSKVNTLIVCDKLLKEEPEPIHSLPIHVDFLPALEVLKGKPDEATRDHDFFLVPKHCNVCERGENWRKSYCMAEIAHINNDMSEKHRKCYKIMKYCISTIIDRNAIDINWYHVKTVALNHSRECSDSSEGCAKCVLKMLRELKHAYETRTLNSFHESGVNILGPYHQSSYTDTSAKILQRFIERLCSVKDTDSCNTLLQPLPDPFSI